VLHRLPVRTLCRAQVFEIGAAGFIPAFLHALLILLEERLQIVARAFFLCLRVLALAVLVELRPGDAAATAEQKHGEDLHWTIPTRPAGALLRPAGG
jgi:uncharacterized membrane protein